jgi:phenylpropionate dioxygenase-like ring-hydroxylating dioxygenase large terminal subunit
MMIYNQWYAILPSKVVKVDKILAVKRLGLNLALFRNSLGELGCVEDQCSHRGAALSIGKIKDGCVQCPFHGLEFDKDGKCTFIPANGRASTLDISRYNVKAYLVREANNIIYLWYGDNGQERDTLPFFDNFVDGSYAYSELEDLWNTHYSRAIENQLDVVHLPFVHGSTIGRGNKTVVNGPKVLFENNVLITSANNDIDSGQKPKTASESVIKETNLNFKFPNVWMNHINPRLKVIIYFAPVDEENTVLYIRFYNKLTSMRWVNQFIAFFGKYANLIVERQDKRVVITQKPKASSYRSGEKLVAGDGPIVMYRKIREQLKNNLEIH